MMREYDAIFDFFVGGQQDFAGPQDDLSTAAACHGDAETPRERVGDFSKGHADTLVEIGDGGLGVGTELALGGSGRSRGLHGMPATHLLAALVTVAAVDVELAGDGLSRDVGLILGVREVFDDVAAAVGIATFAGQRRIMRFVNLLRRRRWTMAVLAMLLA